MSFISYAQNFEDVMLWRALKQIEKGFYIDVGAWSPDLDSVTRAFYEQGWHGINIEPNPEFNQQLQNRRPHDINLQLAVGEREETLSMNFLTNPGLSTLDDTIAQKHQQAGWEVEREPVRVTTLLNIWAGHIPSGQDVHFLKLDVEGFEAAALRGNDWNKNRPWIVVVEATLPMSQIESHSDWEPILLSAGYHYAYFDGLNRFYVAKEHSGLLDAFNAPPNVFDDFVLYREQEAQARAAQSNTMAKEAEAQEMEIRAQLQQALEVAQRAQEKSDQAEARTNEAEGKAQQSASRAEQYRTEIQALKARAEQAESRATQADTKAQEAQARETATSAQLQQALEVAQRAQEKSDQTEARAKRAEGKAKKTAVRAEQYQTEVQALKARTEQVETRAEEAEWHVHELTTQLAQHQAEAQAQLQSKVQELSAKQKELEQLQAHSQWLQNEWDAAKTKIDELNHSSHHWWTVADGLNNELQSIYRSKLWRLNWPVRKLLQGIKAFILFWRDLFIGLLRLPRRTLRWVLTRAMRFVLRREGLKNRARRWLMRHPKLEAHLRAFARQRGLLPAFLEAPSYSDPAQQQDQTVSAETVGDESHHGEIDLTATLTPRAKQIYFQLKAAIEQKQKENG